MDAVKFKIIYLEPFYSYESQKAIVLVATGNFPIKKV